MKKKNEILFDCFDFDSFYFIIIWNWNIKQSRGLKSFIPILLNDWKTWWKSVKNIMYLHRIKFMSTYSKIVIYSSDIELLCLDLSFV